MSVIFSWCLDPKPFSLCLERRSLEKVSSVCGGEADLCAFHGYVLPLGPSFCDSDLEGLDKCWVCDLGILGRGLQGQLGSTTLGAAPHRILWEGGQVWETPLAPPPLQLQQMRELISHLSLNFRKGDQGLPGLQAADVAGFCWPSGAKNRGSGTHDWVLGNRVRMEALWPLSHSSLARSKHAGLWELCKAVPAFCT